MNILNEEYYLLKLSVDVMEYKFLRFVRSEQNHSQGNILIFSVNLTYIKHT